MAHAVSSTTRTRRSAPIFHSNKVSFISCMFARAASRSLFISLARSASLSFYFSATQWQGKNTQNQGKEPEKETTCLVFFCNFQKSTRKALSFSLFFVSTQCEQEISNHYLHAEQRKTPANQQYRHTQTNSMKKTPTKFGNTNYFVYICSRLIHETT